MDKAEFIRLAPMYYALAIALKLEGLDAPITRQTLEDQYTIQIEGGALDDEVCLIDDTEMWDRAIAWLTEREVIEAYPDPFGPAVYRRGDTFTSQVHDLFNSVSPFQNARASGNAPRWTLQALRRVKEEYMRLGIESSDFENPELEWAPIPLDRDNEALQRVVVALDKTIAEVEQSNGYASEHAEERNFVLDNLRLLSKKLKGAGTISVSYIRTHGLNVLKRVQERFIDTAIGEGAKETTNSILHWLHQLINYIIT